MRHTFVATGFVMGTRAITVGALTIADPARANLAWLADVDAPDADGCRRVMRAYALSIHRTLEERMRFAETCCQITAGMLRDLTTPGREWPTVVSEEPAPFERLLDLAFDAAPWQCALCVEGEAGVEHEFTVVTGRMYESHWGVKTLSDRAMRPEDVAALRDITPALRVADGRSRLPAKDEWSRAWCTLTGVDRVPRVSSLVAVYRTAPR